MNNILEENLFQDKRGETLIKLPKTINEQAFNMKNLDNCTIYILDVSSSIYVDNCKNCHFYIAPVIDSFHLQNSSNCICSIACKQLRAKNCNDVTFFLYSVTDPQIEASFDTKFAPYNFAYPNQDKDFKRAGFNTGESRWCKVFDQSLSLGDGHFSLLPPSQFKNEEKTLEGYSKPINPVPIPKQYGGDKIEDIIPGSKSNSNNKKSEAPYHTLNLNTSINLPSSSAPHQTGISEIILVYYNHQNGFVLDEQETVPNHFHRKELEGKIMHYNDTTKQFYSQ